MIHSVSSGVTPLRPDPTKPEQVRQVARDLQGVFIYQMLKEMRATVPQSSLLGGHHEQETIMGLLDQEFAKNISESLDSGLLRAIERQIMGVVDGSAVGEAG